MSSGQIHRIPCLILVKQRGLDAWRIDYYRTRLPHIVSPFCMWQMPFSPLHYVVTPVEGGSPEAGQNECLILDCACVCVCVCVCFRQDLAG